MTDDTVLKQVLKNLKQIGTETVEKGVENVGKITESIITGKELLGDIKTLTPEQEAKKKAEDEKEMARLRQGYGGQGRNVEGEMKQVVKEKEQVEDQQEKQMLEQIKAQREAEEREREQMSIQMGLESTNPAKKKKSRGSAFVQGKKKTNQPDPAAMSQTSEKAGKME